MSETREDPLVHCARREAGIVGLLFLITMCYTVGYCYFNGYDRDPGSLTFVYGFPDWVFWGILAPWSVCVLLSFWFSYVFMSDEDLGGEEESAS